MAQRTFNRSLPLLPGTQFSLFDQILYGVVGPYPIAPGYSKGAQLVTLVPHQEFPDEAKILGYGFTFQGALFNISSILNGVPMSVFARLGQLYGGLMKNSGVVVGEGPLTQLPTDHTMINLLWDGRSNPPWPQALDQTPNLGAQSMLSYNVSLAQPVDIAANDTLAVGLWLTPMIGQNVGIWIMNAAYSILYDDPNR